MNVLILFVAVSVSVAATEASFRPRPRSCCAYWGKDDARKEICGSSKTNCIARKVQSSAESTDPLAQFETLPPSVCSVKDEKLSSDISSQVDVACPDFELNAPSQLQQGYIPMEIRPYAFSWKGDYNITGLEVVVWPSSSLIFRIRYRLVNLALCGSNTYDQDSGASKCRPRCVDMRLNEPNVPDESLELVEDCEAAFYSAADNTVPSHDERYQIHICFSHMNTNDTCYEFRFIPPQMDKDTPKSLFLLDVQALKHNMVSILVPTSQKDVYEGTELTVQIKNKDNEAHLYEERVRVENGLLGLTWRPQHGAYYQMGVVVKNRTVEVAAFSVDNDSGLSLGGYIGVLVVVGAIVGAIGLGLARFFSVRGGLVEPNVLVKNSRCNAKDVYIITNVDNRQHTEVTLTLSRYLKAHCGVREVYFAMDRHTGIESEKQHDPWKWAQTVMEKIAGSEDAFLLIIGAPPKQLGTNRYKDLESNQVFMALQYIRSMATAGRVAVMNFPYSDPATIPTDVPAHLRKTAYMMPKDFNGFLCQLLDVKKRPLCSSLPVPFIKPKIAPSMLDRFPDGDQLSSQIQNLTAAVHQYRMTGIVPELPPVEQKVSEHTGLLNSSNVDHQENLSLADEIHETVHSTPGLKDIESGFMSLSSEEAELRDRNINPEFREA